MQKKTKKNTNLLLYWLYYADACNEFAGPIFASLRLQATQLNSKKCRSGGGPARDLILTPPAPETNAIPVNQVFRSKILSSF